MKISGYIGITIRWLGALTLLIVVWKHAHWSVALSISLMFIESEITGYCLKWHGKSIRTVLEIFEISKP